MNTTPPIYSGKCSYTVLWLATFEEKKNRTLMNMASDSLAWFMVLRRLLFKGEKVKEIFSLTFFLIFDTCPYA